MRDFKIISTEDKKFIEEEVNRYLTNGYKLNGPLYVFQVPTSEEGKLNLRYVQSVSHD